MKLAAIDIGSNAARLLITEVIVANDTAKPVFKKLSMVRVPLRLGFDVFDKGIISGEKAFLLTETMKAFSHLQKAWETDHSIICATSAMREAKNSKEIIEKVSDATGMHIRIITGDEEAALIFENHVAENMDLEKSYLYIDVGGGSTELTLFHKGLLRFKDSFNIGTIRLLQNSVKEDDWEMMKKLVKKHTANFKNIIAIGSGGNINKIFSLSGKKAGKALPIDLLKDFYNELKQVPLEERITTYNLRRDRADVIVPALQIYLQAMKWSGAEEILVPQIGLVDGLIQHLYEQQKQNFIVSQ